MATTLEDPPILPKGEPTKVSRPKFCGIMTIRDSESLRIAIGKSASYWLPVDLGSSRSGESHGWADAR